MTNPILIRFHNKETITSEILYIINNALFSSIKISTTIQFVSVLFGFVLLLTAYNVLLIYQFYSAYFKNRLWCIYI